MNSHKLAKILLSQPDLPIATFANDHTYASKGDAVSHGPLSIGLLTHYSGDHIIIGNMSEMSINKPNWYISKMVYGNIPTDGHNEW